ncbi:MAG: hypothetical protein LC790_02805 [Actinobacteria bacterium]|nr:hypothetical protein [Actinomycetota bacterium]
MIRQEAGLSVERFCAIARIPRPTWYRQRERALGGRAAKGPWPRPVADRLVAVVHGARLRAALPGVGASQDLGADRG